MTSRRDHLLETAVRLFGERGFRAVGIDTILAEAGVAKMTLYSHFRSKDELIAAALGVLEERWRVWLRERTDALSSTPEGRLLAAFDALAEWFSQPGFAGCAFIKAAGEFPAADGPLRRLAAEHSEATIKLFETHARDAMLPDPAEFAKQWHLLFCGAIVTAQCQNGAEVAASARSAGERLLRGARAEQRG